MCGVRSLSFDAKKTMRGNFKPSDRTERDFYRALKRVAEHSGHIVQLHIEPKARLRDAQGMQRALEAYSQKLEPWAIKQSTKMLEQVQKKNKRAYASQSKLIGRLLDEHVAQSEVGDLAVKLLTEQVGLIKSIPLEAGLRAQRIAYEAVLAGNRAAPDEGTIAELEKQLGLSREVAVSRAQLISITETARANASINQARAMVVGSGQYRWHNSGDEAVRPSHRMYRGKRLQGMIFSWDDPPRLDDGMVGHPGTFPRCRCFAEPIFED
jgi:SPP1 gp7 family putative phage head morphogenesis protein